MTRQVIDGITVLFADDGAYITNGDTYTDSAWLGKDASENEWRDATAEEYEEWVNGDLTAEEALEILTGGGGE